MKIEMKLERVYREMLYETLEQKKELLTQKKISLRCKLAISTVNYALKPLEDIGAIVKRPRGFKIIDIKKVLYYWANIRRLEKDIIYKTYFPSVKKLEKSMPFSVVFTAYTAYKLRLKSVPADYSEVYVYAKDLKEIKKRFPPSRKKPNLFVLKADAIKQTSKKNIASLGQIFVDLWNLKEWYASDFIKDFTRRLGI